MTSPARPQWTSYWSFILVATGAAVGLGNVWRFPYMAGQNGGGAFVMVYLLCVAAVAVPILIAELMIGRRGAGSPVHAMQEVARESGASYHWRWVGWLGALGGFMILSYYSVIAGWAMAYVFKLAGGEFGGAAGPAVQASFDALVSSPARLLFWHTAFMALTVGIVAKGVEEGLEKHARWMMIALFIALVLLVLYALTVGNAGKGIGFLLRPDFSRLTAAGVLAALGHAFFSVGVGMGAMMIYGSYLPRSVSLAPTAGIIALADTAVALLAGLAIFPIVYAFGLEPSAGPSLIFQTLPLAFGHMPGGGLFGTLFFLLLVFAALSSSIALLEPMVAHLMESRDWSRWKAGWLCGGVAWLLGVGSAFSFNVWKDWKFFGKTYFEAIDFVSANLMLPLCGLLIALFAGWFMARSTGVEELGPDDHRAYVWWEPMIAVVAPLALILVMVELLGVL